MDVVFNIHEQRHPLPTSHHSLYRCQEGGCGLCPEFFLSWFSCFFFRLALHVRANSLADTVVTRLEGIPHRALLLREVRRHHVFPALWNAPRRCPKELARGKFFTKHPCTILLCQCDVDALFPKASRLLGTRTRIPSLFFRVWSSLDSES